jgi:adenylate cyclase class 2
MVTSLYQSATSALEVTRGGNVREVEVKYHVRDTEALLVALKAQQVELSSPVRQDDQAYAPQGWSYGESKLGVPFVRLRTVDGRHLFTLKQPAENALSCDEHECIVSDRDQMHAAIVAMGFYPTVRIVKTRRTGVLGDVHLCVDEVEDLGVFLELERMVPRPLSGEAVQAELIGLVASLGIEAERTHETYDSLIRAARSDPARSSNAFHSRFSG